ncbi:hypothetical protein ACGFYY_25445 [Streptomyces sp. NPDC048331]|uniref:hypothetical protein n=1 Tax=Streptomyces sp. NPDC048331 TaxID=3365534 RepID=UPI00371221D6
MERWRLTYANRSAMLGEVPATYKTHEADVDTAGLEEQEILDRLHHVIEELTSGAGVLTDAEKI